MSTPRKTNKTTDWREVERRLTHVAIERIQAPAAGIVDAYCKIELTLFGCAYHKYSNILILAAVEQFSQGTFR
jgi:hypothetical protein